MARSGSKIFRGGWWLCPAAAMLWDMWRRRSIAGDGPKRLFVEPQPVPGNRPNGSCASVQHAARHNELRSIEVRGLEGIAACYLQV